MNPDITPPPGESTPLTAGDDVDPVDDDDRHCVARARRTGRRCKRFPVPGATVCALHGGRAPQVMAAAARRQAARAALRAVETFGLPREVDPHTALAEELHRAAGAVDWLGAVVAELPTDDVTSSAYVGLWQEERDRLARVAKTCHEVGIEERRVRIAEATGAQLASVMRAVLDRLGLTDEQRSAALEVVPEEFRRAEVGGHGSGAQVLPMPSPGVPGPGGGS